MTVLASVLHIRERTQWLLLCLLSLIPRCFMHLLVRLRCLPGGVRSLISTVFFDICISWSEGDGLSLMNQIRFDLLFFSLLFSIIAWALLVRYKASIRITV